VIGVAVIAVLVTYPVMMGLTARFLWWYNGREDTTHDPDWRDNRQRECGDQVGDGLVARCPGCEELRWNRIGGFFWWIVMPAFLVWLALIRPTIRTVVRLYNLATPPALRIRKP
jgi:hypothetical protein